MRNVLIPNFIMFLLRKWKLNLRNIIIKINLLRNKRHENKDGFWAVWICSTYISMYRDACVTKCWHFIPSPPPKAPLRRFEYAIMDIEFENLNASKTWSCSWKFNVRTRKIDSYLSNLCNFWGDLGCWEWFSDRPIWMFLCRVDGVRFVGFVKEVTFSDIMKNKNSTLININSRFLFESAW